MRKKFVIAMGLALLCSAATMAATGEGPAAKNHVKGAAKAQAQAVRKAERKSARQAAHKVERQAARTAERRARHQAERQAARAGQGPSQNQASTPAQRAAEPLAPKDFSRDFQVPAGPEVVQGDVLLSESFDAGIPPGWTVIDNAGTGVVWTNLAGCGESNYTDGSGDAACVSSDDVGVAEFDTELRTPVLDLTAYSAPAALSFNTNYQNFAGLDFFEVDVSTNGAAGPWTNLLSWNEDHGGSFAPPGEQVTLDVGPYTGQANVMFRFHYFDPNSGDWDWYAQVDDLELTVTSGGGEPPPSILEIPTVSQYGLAALALLLAAAAFVTLRRQH